MRRRKTFQLIAAILLLGIGSALAYLSVSDLGWVGSWLTGMATEAMSRPLVVEGRFEADLLSAAPRVVATDVVLGDPDGDLSPGMVRVDRLEGNVSFSSLYSLPVRIEKLHIQGGLVRLGPASDGRPNWHFGSNGKPEGTTPKAMEIESDFLPVTFGSALLESVILRYEPPGGSKSMVLEIDRLELEPVDPEGRGVGRHTLAVTGQFRDRPFHTTGTTTRLERLIFLDDPVDLDLEAGLAEVVASVVGSVGRLWVLGEPDLRLGLEGPEIAQLTEAFDLPSLGSGRFEAKARTSTASESVQFEIDADLGDLRATAQGNLDDLLEPRIVDLAVEATGADLAASGALLGVGSLPGGSFELSGGLSIDHGRVAFRDFTGSAAGSRLEVDGALGPSPAFAGTDIDFTASGADLRPFEALAGFPLPGGVFESRGRLAWEKDLLRFHDVSLSVGGSTARADGALGAPPSRQGTDLQVDLSVESLGAIGGPLQTSLPAMPFDASARLTSAGERLRLEAESIRLGDDTMDIRGTFSPSSPLLGAKLEMQAAGPDLGATAGRFGLPDLPASSWELEGGFTTGAKGYELQATTLRSESDMVRVSGFVGRARGLAGTDLTIAGTGKDASRIPIAPHGLDLPTAPWDVSGRLCLHPGKVQLDGVEASLGEVTGRASGTIAIGETDWPTRLDLDVRGQSLAEVQEWGDLPDLPDEPFSVTGQVEIESGGIRLESVAAVLSENSLQLKGELPTDPSGPGGDLTFEGSGPELSGLVRAAVRAELAGQDLGAAADTLAGHPWQLRGRLVVGLDGFDLEPLRLHLGDGELEANGTLGREPDLVGTDLHLTANGENAAPLAALLGISAPAEPFSLETRIRREPGRTLLDGFQGEIGNNGLSLDGALGDPPRFADTDVIVEASGTRIGLLRDLAVAPGAEAIERISPPILELPFDISGRVRGSLDSFDLEDMKVAVGGSDVSGNLSLDRGHPLTLQGRLHSGRVDLHELEGLGRPAPTAPQDPPTESRESSGQRMLIPDDPLSLEWLPDATGEFRLDIAELLTPATRLLDLELGVRMAGGHLTLDPVAAKAASGGRVTGRLLVRPAAGGLDLTTELRARDVSLERFAPGDEPNGAVSLDLDLELASSGSSFHGLAAASTGRIKTRLGAGKVDRELVTDVFPRILTEVVDTLNPFHQNEHIANLECGFVYLELEDGLATIEPLVLQSERATILGNGRIRFADETLDLDWAIKPRKGLGMSSVASATNPYLKLGGTLARPQVELKPIDATLSAGAAVATGGLSFLAKGLWRRMTSGKDVCKKARKKTARDWAEDP